MNNFVAAKDFAARFGWQCSFIFTIRGYWLSASAGQVCLQPHDSSRLPLAGQDDCKGIVPKNQINLNTPHSFNVVINVDRSDRKAGMFLINMHSAKTETQIIATAPGIKSLVKRR
jgi:hypothetical protein